MMTTRVVLCLSFAFLFYVAHGVTVTITNKCTDTIWPATLTGDGKQPQLSSTGFELAPQASKTLDVPSPWTAGRIWGRTRCSNNNGQFSCETGNCGSGQVECNGLSGATPATLAEFTLAANGGQDFYDVSNVDGFNLRLSVAPQGGSGTCKPSSCPTDINPQCLDDLKVTSSDGRVIACKSACVAFGKPEYCCSGDHDKPETCPATSYSEFFKRLCPDAYSYAYDDNKSTFTCNGSPNYVVTFCP